MMFMMAGILAFGLSSCGDDTEEVKPRPSFDWKGGTDYVSSNTSVPAGSEVLFGINARGEENLKSVGVRVSYNGAPSTIFMLTSSGDSTITSLRTRNFSIDIPYQVGNTPGTETVTITVTMANDETFSRTVVLTVTAQATNVTERSNISAGAQNNANGSFFSVSQSQTFTIAESNNNQSIVDMIYYHGAVNAATLASPNDAQVTSLFPNVTSWTTRNATRMRLVTMTEAQYQAITLSTDVDALIQAGNPTLTAVTQLKVGDVVLFVTSGGTYYGIIRVKAIQPASPQGQITFDMKVVG